MDTLFNPTANKSTTIDKLSHLDIKPAASFYNPTKTPGVSIT